MPSPRPILPIPRDPDGGFDPLSPRPTGPTGPFVPEVLRTPNGNLSAIVLHAGPRKYSLKVGAEKTDKGSTANLTFSLPTVGDLSVVAALTATEITLKASGAGLDYELVLDMSDQSSTKKPVRVAVAGNVTSGVFDTDTFQVTINTSLDHWLPDAVSRDLQPFRAHLSSEAHRLNDIGHNTLANAAAIRSGTVGRAACWGFAGMGGAAACVLTAGIGCVLAGLGFGVAASICSDQWP